MSHSLNRIWIHGIWATKERQPFLEPAVENRVYQHMYDEFRGIDCPARIINGMPDHVHALFLLSSMKCVSEVFQYIKGGSSHWINERSLINDKFAWQTGYAAYSVSESQVEKVYRYILNQKEHHRKKSFEDETNELRRLHGLGFA